MRQAASPEPLLTRQVPAHAARIRKSHPATSASTQVSGAEPREPGLFCPGAARHTRVPAGNKPFLPPQVRGRDQGKLALGVPPHRLGDPEQHQLCRDISSSGALLLGTAGVRISLSLFGQTAEELVGQRGSVPEPRAAGKLTERLCTSSPLGKQDSPHTISAVYLVSTNLVPYL